MLMDSIYCSLPKETKSLRNTTSNTRQWSQQSASSQMTPSENFLDKAVQLGLDIITVLNEVCSVSPMEGSSFNKNMYVFLYIKHDIITMQSMLCVIVAITDNFIADENEWCYRSCDQCLQTGKDDKAPFLCRVGHQTEAEIWRFLLCLNNNAKYCYLDFAYFLFWNVTFWIFPRYRLRSWGKLFMKVTKQNLCFGIEKQRVIGNISCKAPCIHDWGKTKIENLIS